MYKKIEDCLKHQEQIKKLKKTKRKKIKDTHVHDECEERGEEHVRGAVKKKLTTVKSRYTPDIERIKPSIKVRDEYSFSRHLQCVMENSTIGKNQKQKKLKNKKIKSVKFNNKGHIDHTEDSTDSNSSSECDEICSFDSDINLSGVTLTVEDQATVMDNYTKAHTSRSNTGGNMNKSGIDENK